MNNNWHKKEKPLLGLTGLGGGVDGLSVVGAAAKTYLDEVFSTFLYTGTSTSSRNINNGIDLSGEGGMVWIKCRSDAGTPNLVYDTVRGANERLITNSDTDNAGLGSRLTGFNDNGFVLGNDGEVNSSSHTYSSWTFRKTPGFCDVVTYTGNGSNRTISHSLGSVPGMILIKNLSSTENWIVYHRTLKATHHVRLNQTNASASSMTMFNDTEPTASVFSVGTNSGVNTNGDNYVAYLFAGGASDAATARGVRFDGTDDYLSLGASSDFDMGTGDFTIECWLNRDDTSNNSAWTLGSYDNGMELYCYSDDSLRVYGDNGGTASWLIQSAANVISPGVWNHVAVVRDSGTLKLFQNGTLLGSTAHSSAMPNNGETTDFFIGVEMSSSNTIPATNPYFDGEISNFRVVKGTAVYTSSFRPPYEPLTNITNTKLLCCNNSSVTGSTVTPGTITAHSSPTATTNSPFDDSEGFKFGEGGDQNLIKTGSYIGTGSATHRKVELGFEPQWVLLKNTNSTGWWTMSDTLRGLDSIDGTSSVLYANANNAEGNSGDLTCHSTGFGMQGNSSSSINGNGNTIIYMALRRPDGYVGKPPELGTGVFNVVAGVTGPPSFVTNFVADMGFWKANIGTTSDWNLNTRLTGQKYLKTNASSAEADGGTNMVWDHNNGFSKNNSSFQVGTVFKRHKGMDVVYYTGNGVSGLSIPHSMNAAPEMMIIKRRDNTQGWLVYHIGLNGGEGNTYEYGINLSDSAEWQESSTDEAWGGADPTSTHFTVGELSTNNTNGADYLALLFSSVSGISKVGVYAGSNSAQSITTGFQPRFVIIKNTANTDDWYVLDTTRGWAAGDDKRIYLNQDTAQSDQDVGAPTSTGFDLTANVRAFNQAGRYYIYYAHA